MRTSKGAIPGGAWWREHDERHWRIAVALAPASSSRMALPEIARSLHSTTTRSVGAVGQSAGRASRRGRPAWSGDVARLVARAVERRSPEPRHRSPSSSPTSTSKSAPLAEERARSLARAGAGRLDGREPLVELLEARLTSVRNWWSGEPRRVGRAAARDATRRRRSSCPARAHPSQRRVALAPRRTARSRTRASCRGHPGSAPASAAGARPRPRSSGAAPHRPGLAARSCSASARCTSVSNSRRTMSTSIDTPAAWSAMTPMRRARTAKRGSFLLGMIPHERRQVGVDKTEVLDDDTIRGDADALASRAALRHRDDRGAVHARRLDGARAS